ncbi:MAG: hypothetical protein AAF357_13195 [Verrucomicrobiota bacterium]
MKLRLSLEVHRAMRAFLFSFVYPLALAGFLFAEESDFEQWREVDANKDGVLTLEEVPTPLQGFFDRVDTNTDGKLDEAELKVAARRL